MIDPVLRLSAMELARRIRRRELRSRDVVERHIARIEAWNPAINAVVRDRFAAARAEADAVDARLASAAGDEVLPPLYGVPCTIKESFAVAGMPQTSGMVTRKAAIPARDAPTVARLRAAGAITLGVTNVSELCMWMETHNRVYGRTRNPYDPSRIVGGSSGGEGAIVGAGGSPFGLGADIGGSIRMPAFFNGVFGHKPSGGLVPGTGQYPLAEGDALRMLSTGPIARRAEDLWPLLQILAGPDGEDPACVPFRLGDPARTSLAGLRVLDVPDDGSRAVSDDLARAQRAVAQALARRGARVETRRVDAFRHAFDIWSSMMQVAAETSFRELLFEDAPRSPWLELARLALGRSPHTLPSVALAAAEGIGKRFPGRARRFVRLGRKLARTLADELGQGVMLYPSYPTVAPRHGEPLRTNFLFVYTALLNALELPVTQVPLGLGAHGLPLGVQVAAAPGNDHLTIAVAVELERAFGGWVPPEGPPQRR